MNTENLSDLETNTSTQWREYNTPCKRGISVTELLQPSSNSKKTRTDSLVSSTTCFLIKTRVNPWGVNHTVTGS